MDATNERDLEAMVDAYIEAGLWAGLDWGEENDGNPEPLDANYSAEDLAPEAREAIAAEVRSFAADNAADLAEIEPDDAGHDFLLTRDGHGAGFWDRGLGEIGDRLTDAAKVYGDSGFYVGDDKKVYVT